MVGSDLWKAADNGKHSWVTNSQYSWTYILKPSVPKGTDMEKDITKCVKSPWIPVIRAAMSLPSRKVQNWHVQHFTENSVFFRISADNLRGEIV